MTLQIGMMGSDGIVVVGDTWQYVEPKDRPWHGYDASKIRLSSDRRIAVFCAHDMDASFAVAEEILQKLSGDPDPNRRTGILNIGDQLAEGSDSECLIVFADPNPTLYRLSHPKSVRGKCEEIYGCVPIGDQWNTAFHLAMRFYRPGLSCQQLSRLGSLMVVSAGHISSGSIRGLEGITCDKEGIRLWEREECRLLETAMTNFENEIGDSILGP
jgi:hypothetical protein